MRFELGAIFVGLEPERFEGFDQFATIARVDGPSIGMQPLHDRVVVLNSSAEAEAAS